MVECDCLAPALRIPAIAIDDIFFNKETSGNSPRMNTITVVVNNDVSARGDIVCVLRWRTEIKVYTISIKTEFAILDQQP